MAKKNETRIDVTIYFHGEEVDIYELACGFERNGYATCTQEDLGTGFYDLLCMTEYGCWADSPHDFVTKTVRDFMEAAGAGIFGYSLIYDADSGEARALLMNPDESPREVEPKADLVNMFDDLIKKGRERAAASAA